MRRGRALPGPLKTVQRRRGTGSWLGSFVVFGVAVVAIAVAVAGFSDRRGPVVAQATPETAPRKASTVAVTQKAEPAPIARQQAAAAPRFDAPAFKLDQLPVLEADGAGFDADAAPVPARSVARTGLRKPAGTAQR